MRKGFTLIELLVVVAVIAVLLAVLLPALAGARESALGVQCGSRLRQVTTGWYTYAHDNAGYLVPGQPGRYSDPERNVYDVGNGKQYRPRWYVILGAQTDLYCFENPSPEREDEHSMQITNEMFICPSTPDWTSTRNCSYGYNHQFLGNTRFVQNEEALGFINYPVHIGMITSPSNTVMAGDSMGTAAGKPEALRTPNRNDGSRDPELRALGGHGYIIDPPRLTDDCDYADRRNRAPEHRSAPHPRHQGKATIAFCDGHIERRSLRELGYWVNEDGSVAHSNEFTTNKFFSGTGRDRDPPTLSGR